MNSKPKIDACPQCGSKDGFFINVLAKGIRAYDWSKNEFGGNVIYDTTYILDRETSPRCMGCGKSVRAAMAKEKP